MKRTLETAAWSCSWASWIALALFGFAPFGILLAIAAFATVVRMALADDDPYADTVFGREAADFDRIIANGGIE